MAHNAWFALIQPLMPTLAWHLVADCGRYRGWRAAARSARFLAYPHLARALFLMKLPYLAADLATGYVLIKLVEPCWRRRVLALWLLNPIVIFVSAVFGRHDSPLDLRSSCYRPLALQGTALRGHGAARARRRGAFLSCLPGAVLRFCFSTFASRTLSPPWWTDRFLAGDRANMLIAATGNSPTL